MSQALHLALVGFANSGKSTFFNALTGAKQQTGNWTGVTVATKQQNFSFNKKQALLSDLPGISSLASRNQQGKDLSITQDFIKSQSIDCLINVVDATQLKRQLYLTTQLLELGLPVLLVINKADRKEAQNVDTKILAKELGCKVIIANSLSKNTLKDVEAALLEMPKASTRPKKLIFPEKLLNQIEDKSSTDALFELECGSCNDDGTCQQTNEDATLSVYLTISSLIITPTFRGWSYKLTRQICGTVKATWALMHYVYHILNVIIFSLRQAVQLAGLIS